MSQDLYSAGLVAIVLGLIACSNLAQFALAATTNTTTTTPTDKLTAMPGSLDSARLHLAEPLKDIKTGNIQAAALQITITNQTIARLHQGMLSIMNAHKTPSALMTAGNTSQQQEMLNKMNSNKTPSPLMVGGGAGNPHQQQSMQNMLSILNNSNSNTSITETMGGNKTTAKK